MYSFNTSELTKDQVLCMRTEDRLNSHAPVPGFPDKRGPERVCPLQRLLCVLYLVIAPPPTPNLCHFDLV